jgi:hypothetical protein
MISNDMPKSIDQNNISELYSEIINEDLTSGGVFGGDVGGHMGIENEDWYAPGDMRNPFGWGVATRKGMLKPKKKRKKKKTT